MEMARNVFAENIDALKGMLLLMGNHLERSLEELRNLLQKRDLKSFEFVKTEDDKVDQLEIEIEKKCLSILALQAPVAHDLRFITGALKMSTDLERIGDHIRKIARKYAYYMEGTDAPVHPAMVDMINILRGMLKDMIDAFNERDMAKARQVIARDADVNAIQKEFFREIIDVIMKSHNAEQASACVHLLFIARSLERIGDHIKNLGERIIFMETGELVLGRFSTQTDVP